eukprot:CAMPEP_0197677976 /NCGR_PEP_ID=MMETSP1338-20131121/89274_1 /TAXON_ID=43686 ORGANISM="Pelagodinium beii, Strain RCC1491" /NCGR_SAMPLE_ID=MMETSP1338 /ASSEMBLY_ACC=CAM_ASM_000754 /LENGTH=189 /DNA_ID=CAMNT_0043258865 /DNA_START=318 /DNA_END=884 /DNA_ORIENTATION=+
MLLVLAVAASVLLWSLMIIKDVNISRATRYLLVAVELTWSVVRVLALSTEERCGWNSFTDITITDPVTILVLGSLLFTASVSSVFLGQISLSCCALHLSSLLLAVFIAWVSLQNAAWKNVACLSGDKGNSMLSERVHAWEPYWLSLLGMTGFLPWFLWNKNREAAVLPRETSTITKTMQAEVAVEPEKL